MKPGTEGFVGNRLREGREARGLTATALASTIGVSSAAITQYEQGTQTPRPEVMERISVVLRLPVAFFRKPIDRPPGVVFWRSLESAAKTARLAAEKRLGWVQDITGLLCEHFDFPSLFLPDFDLPVDPVAITSEMIERASSQTREHWRIGDGPIPSITDLLERMGVVLARDDLNAPALDALSKWCQGYGAYCLVTSGKESAARARLNVLHELGHLVLHRHLDRWHLDNRKLHQLIERQAFEFAGAFALPAESFAAEVYSFSLDAFLDLKPTWKFSVGMMVKRCETLGMIREETSQRLWRSISTRGWRQGEPLDDELPHEYPKLLADGIRSLLRESESFRGAILEACPILPRDIEDLTGLEHGVLDPDFRDRVVPIPASQDQTPQKRPTQMRLIEFPKVKSY